MKILLTGDKGRIGSRVRPLLKEAGHTVVGYDLADNLNLSDTEMLVKKSRNCDVIIHLAAIPHPQKGSIGDYFKTNVEGTFNVLQAAKQNEVQRVVYSSSTGYYGCDTNIHGSWRPLYLPIDEMHPPLVAHQQFYGWLSAYNQSKVMAEQLMAWYGTNREVQTVVLRIAPANSKEEQYGEVNVAHLSKTNWRLVSLLANCHPDYAAQALYLATFAEGLPGWSVFNIVDRFLPAGLTPQMVGALFGIETEESLFSSQKAQDILGWRPCEER